MPEPDLENLRVTRDHRGRLALSRPRMRMRPDTPAKGILGSASKTSSTTSGMATMANSAKAVSPQRTRKASTSDKPQNLEKPPQTMWGPVEDVQLLALQRSGKSWDYIEGKLDNRGKGIAALKARFVELTTESQEPRGGKKVEVKGQKEDGNPAEPPIKTNGAQAGKDKKEKKGSDSKNGSSKGGILKDSSKVGNDNEGGGAKSSKKPTSETAIVAKEGYIGKDGRGEVRFFNGVPILYKHSGANAEALDAETVAMISKEATKHDRSKWLTVVSRLFDKTGVRMDPEVARRAMDN